MFARFLLLLLLTVVARPALADTPHPPPAPPEHAETPFLVGRLHNDGGPVQSISFSVDGACVTIGTRSGTMRMHTLQPRAIKATLLDTAGFVAYSPIGYPPGQVTMITANQLGKVNVYYPDDLERQSWMDGIGSVAALSGDGRFLAAGFGGLDVSVWEMYRWQPAMNSTAMPTLPGVVGTTFSMAFNNDGSRLAYAGCVNDKENPTPDASGSMILWDVLTGKILHWERKDAAQFNQVAFSADGHKLAWAGFKFVDGKAQGVVSLWDVSANTGMASPAIQLPIMQSVAFSADGSVLAAGGDDGAVRLFDVSTGAQLASVDAQQGAVRALAFKADGTLLASGGDDSSVKLWDYKKMLPSR